MLIHPGNANDVSEVWQRPTSCLFNPTKKLYVRVCIHISKIEIICAWILLYMFTRGTACIYSGNLLPSAQLQSVRYPSVSGILRWSSLRPRQARRPPRWCLTILWPYDCIVGSTLKASTGLVSEVGGSKRSRQSRERFQEWPSIQEEFLVETCCFSCLLLTCERLSCMHCRRRFAAISSGLCTKMCWTVSPHSPKNK